MADTLIFFGVRVAVFRKEKKVSTARTAGQGWSGGEEMKLKDFDEIIDTMAATPHCDFVEALLIMNNAPTVDAVPVVRCKDCVTHGNCLTEDTFRIAKIGNPFCCGGKRREDEHDE